MKRLILCLLLLPFVSLAVAADDKDKDPADRDLLAFQGTWLVVSMEHNGHESAPEDFAGQSSSYEKNRWTLKVGDKVRRRGIITLDPSQTPKAINTWDSDGPHADDTSPGIYEVTGDTLKLCFAPPGEKRPETFTTKSGTGSFFAVYKKKKS
jgi:uncharacterized protein (TIGR03067 family)